MSVPAAQCLTVSAKYQEEGVSVEEHVLRSDGSSQVVGALLHKLSSILGGDVLHHNSQLWHLPQNGFQLLLYEHLRMQISGKY